MTLVVMRSLSRLLERIAVLFSKLYKIRPQLLAIISAVS